MANHGRELAYAVRIPVVLHYMGGLCLPVGLLTLVPMTVAFFGGEQAVSGRYAVVAAVFLVIFGLTRRLRVARKVQVNEAMVLAALIFTLTPLLMTYPLTGVGLSFEDALFEAVSGVTTTGLSTLPTMEGLPAPFLFARSWMQWIGGLGVMVLCLAMLFRPGGLTKSLSASNDYEDDLVGGTRAHAQRVLLAYASLTAGGFLLLLGLSRDPFNALLYSLCAVSTGGFAPHDGSLTGFGGPGVSWGVSLICLAGAVPTAFFHRILVQRHGKVREDLQLRGLLLCLLSFGSLLVALLVWGEGWSVEKALHHGGIMLLSAQSTAGFSSIGVSELGQAGQGILILAMAVGGGVGSTAGGIKILRLLILLRIVQLMVRKTLLTRHTVADARLGGRRVDEEELRDALGLILLYLGVMFLSWLPFLAYGYDPLASLFEVVSATATVGLSAGVTGPDLPTVLKGVLCFDMMMGRLEILAWLLLWLPGTWFGRRREAR